MIDCDIDNALDNTTQCIIIAAGIIIPKASSIPKILPHLFIWGLQSKTRGFLMLAINYSGL